jgi:hypothetical protein
MAAAKESGISKMDAVRKALKALGKDAMPLKLRDYIMDTFGLDMTTGHVSNYKTFILKRKKRKKAAAAKAESTLTTLATANSVPSKGSTLSLTDIEAVKNLVGRVGEDNLKGLIGILGG